MAQLFADVFASFDVLHNGYEKATCASLALVALWVTAPQHVFVGAATAAWYVLLTVSVFHALVACFSFATTPYRVRLLGAWLERVSRFAFFMERSIISRRLQRAQSLVLHIVSVWTAAHAFLSPQPWRVVRAATLLAHEAGFTLALPLFVAGFGLLALFTPVCSCGGRWAQTAVCSPHPPATLGDLREQLMEAASGVVALSAGGARPHRHYGTLHNLSYVETYDGDTIFVDLPGAWLPGPHGVLSVFASRIGLRIEHINWRAPTPLRLPACQMSPAAPGARSSSLDAVCGAQS